MINHFVNYNIIDSIILFFLERRYMKTKKSWIVIVFILTFLLSLLFSLITNIISYKFGIIATIVAIILVISIGILFDLIGASSLTSKESTFHAMSAQKVKGAKTAIFLIQNNAKVSSICNDIIGDICGIVSGGLGAVLAINIAEHFHVNAAYITMIVAALISALTVGGKAIFKNVAIKHSDTILFRVAKIVNIFKK